MMSLLLTVGFIGLMCLRVPVAMAIGLSTIVPLLLRVGPLRPGGGHALIVDASVPGVGNVIEQLADEVEIETEGDAEYLCVRLAYAGSD